MLISSILRSQTVKVVQENTEQIQGPLREEHDDASMCAIPDCPLRLLTDHREELRSSRRQLRAHPLLPLHLWFPLCQLLLMPLALQNVKSPISLKSTRSTVLQVVCWLPSFININ